MKIRSAGFMAAISSLPSEFGIGGFTRDAYDFVSNMAARGFHYWSILPITSLGRDNSPFNGISCYAGNSLFINPYHLLELGLLSEAELSGAKYWGSEYVVDYAFSAESMSKLLHLAIDRLDSQTYKAVEDFAELNKEWIVDYARYSVLAAEYGDNWQYFPENLRLRQKDALIEFDKLKSRELFYYYFEQYIFYDEWFKLKNFANGIGVGIIGAVSYSTPHNSVSVWCNPKEFLLDETGSTIVQDGYAPNLAVPTGFLLGKPSYDFKAMRLNKFKMLRDRLKHALKLYDGVTWINLGNCYKCWCADIGESSARNGRYVFNDGMDLIELVKKDNPDKLLICYDPYEHSDDVEQFIENSGFLNVVSPLFGFEYGIEKHKIYNYSKNNVAATSFFDSNTALGWLYEMEPTVRENALRYVSFTNHGWGAGGADCASTPYLARALMQSAASIVFVSMQDLCGFGQDTRLKNSLFPGDGDWKFRLYYSAFNNIKYNLYNDLISLYERNEPYRR